MKKARFITFVALVVSLLVAFMVFSSAALLGDTNDDGKITATDARFTLRIASKLEAANEKQQVICDVNRDGKITANDARKILRVSAKIDSESDLIVDLHTHDFSFKHEVTEEGSCLKDRVIVYYCECGEAQTKTVKVDHSYSDKYTTIQEPTCINEGYAVRLCTVCKSENPDDTMTLDPLSHDEMEDFCDTCAQEHRYSYHHKYTFRTEIIEEPTCTKDGYMYVYCVCGASKKEIIESEGHSYTLGHMYVATEPTCTEDGVAFPECDFCLETSFNKRERIPATGHDMDEYYCMNCNYFDSSYKFSMDDWVSIPGVLDFEITDVIVDDFQYNYKRLIIKYKYTNRGYTSNGYQASLRIDGGNFSSDHEYRFPWSIVDKHSFNSSASSCSKGQSASAYTTIFITSTSTEYVHIKINSDITITYIINLDYCNSPSEKDYQEGYNAGYADGLNDSATQTDAYSDGYSDGKTNKTRIQKSENGSSYKLDYDYNKGYEDGFKDGCINTYNTYYKKGYEAGKNSGYTNDSNGNSILKKLASKTWTSFLVLDGSYYDYDYSWTIKVTSGGSVTVSKPGYTHNYTAKYLGVKDGKYYFTLESNSYYADSAMAYDSKEGELYLLPGNNQSTIFR